MEKIIKFINLIKRQGIYPDFRIIESAATEPEIVIQGKKMYMFSSNNYLSLCLNKNVINSAIEVIKKHGLGPGGSRLMCGNIDLINNLEKKLANFINVDDIITFPSGYMANAAVFRAVMDPFIANFPYKRGDGVIFSDQLNHATIVEGCRLSYADKEVYKHMNMVDLEKKLAKYTKRKHKLIVTDGVFSMDGDLAPLPNIVELAKKYNALVMVDDAHGIGVVGENGGGTVQYYNLEGDVDIIMGSFDKALGAMGGFLGGCKELVDYLRIAARPYVFSSTLSACLVGGVSAAIDEIHNNPCLLVKVKNNALYLREKLHEEGFTILGEKSVPIVPVLVGSEKKGIEFSRKLYEMNIFATCTRWPAVERGRSRIRITPMASHTKEHLDILIESLVKIGKDLKLIK